MSHCQGNQEWDILHQWGNFDQEVEVHSVRVLLGVDALTLNLKRLQILLQWSRSLLVLSLTPEAWVTSTDLFL